MDNVLDYARPVHRPLPWGWAPWLAIGSWWGSVLLGPLFLILVPLALVASAILIIRRKWRWLVASLLFSPMALAASVGAFGYFTGTAKLWGMGLMRYPTNVQPATRMQWSSGGCMVTGNEWMTQLPHNLTVMSLFHCFGTMHGAYDGPYPTETDALAALAGGAPLDLKELRAGRVTVAGVTATLAANLGEKLLDGFPEGPAIEPDNPQILAEYGTPQVAVFGGRCLVLGIPAAPLVP